MEIKVEFKLDVNAGAGKLWGLLTDVEGWPNWVDTHFVKPSAPGPIGKGSSFTVELAGMKWDMTVTEAERPNRLAWVGRRPGLTGVHEWEFKESDGKTLAITREVMTGWLVNLAYPFVRKGLSDADEKWLAALKKKAETS